MNDIPSYVIREYADSDFDGVKACFEELQLFEKKIEPWRMDPQAMADTYVKNLLAKKNQIFVAETKTTVKNEIIGFLAILTGQFIDPHLNNEVAMSYVNDLVVLPTYRRLGVASALMKRGEDFASQNGSQYVQLTVLAQNETAYAAYGRLGYSPYEVTLMKRLNIY